MSFPFYQQPDHMDCGPTCLRMVAKYHGRPVALEKLRALSETTRSGSDLHNIAAGAEAIGFRTLGVKVALSKLITEQPLPCVLHWNSNHFVVLHKITGGPSTALRASKPLTLHIADPGHGLLTYTEAEFLEHWMARALNEKPRKALHYCWNPLHGWPNAMPMMKARRRASPSSIATSPLIRSSSDNWPSAFLPPV